MACNNCRNCNDNTKGASQRSLVAYFQPCGAGVNNQNLNAMDDGNLGSQIKVTGGKRNIRGTRTAKRRRQSDGTSKICYYTEGSPDDNSITLEFAQCGCGGYDAPELAATGSFDLYNLQACCGSADMESGWSKMHVYRCITFNSATFSDETSYDPDDDNDLTIQYDANYVDDYYIYPLAMNELLAGSGADAGSRVDSMVYRGTKTGCSQGCGDDCADNWYSVTNEGTVIYRQGKSYSIKNVSIPGYIANNNARIGICGNTLLVTAAGGYYTTTLDSYGNPGSTWTFHSVAGMTAVNVSSTGSSIVIYGNAGSTTGYRVWEVACDGNSYTTAYSQNASGNTITDYDQCGSDTLAVGFNGKVLIGSTCGTLSDSPVSPSSFSVMAAGIQPGGTFWVGDSTGKVYYSTDRGNSWTAAALPAGATIIRDIVWVDQGVGYILTNTDIFSTADGGNTWTSIGTDNRIESVAGVTQFTNLRVPCCSNMSKSVNSLMVTGITTSGAGGLWQGTVSSCT